MLRLLLLVCLQHIAGSTDNETNYYSDYSAGEYHARSLILWPSIKIEKIFYLNHNLIMRQQHFGLLDQTDHFSSTSSLVRHSNFLQRRARIPSSFSCQLRSGDPLAQKRESEAFQTFEVSSQPRWVYVFICKQVHHLEASLVQNPRSTQVSGINDTAKKAHQHNQQGFLD